MTKPTIIKGPLPGQAVEEFRLRNGGKLPGAHVVVSLDMVDDALNLLEGWIRRYCKPSFLSEHLDDLANKRSHLANAQEASKSETKAPMLDASVPTPLERAIVLLDEAAARVGDFANPNIVVVGRDEIEAIIREELAPESETKAPMLDELCTIFGWQGGTIHQAVEHARQMHKALREISKGRGPYKQDPLAHADACIEAMKGAALAALCGAYQGDDDE